MTYTYDWQYEIQCGLRNPHYQSKFHLLTLYTAAFKHCGIFFVEGNQIRRSTRSTALLANMVETQPAFDKEYRVGIREYQFVK